MNRFVLFFTINLIVITQLFGNDTLHINRLLHLADSLQYDEPIKSLTYAKEGSLLSTELQDYNKIKRSLQLVSNAHWYANQLDSVDYYNELRVKHAEDQSDYQTLGELYSEYAIELFRISKFKESVVDFNHAIENYKKVDNDNEIAYCTNYLGIAYHNMDQYDQAMSYYTDAMKKYADLGNKISEGGALESIAIIHKQLGDYNKSIEMHAQSRRLYEAAKDTFGLAYNANNLGIVYKQLDQYGLAIAQYSLLLEYANILDHQGLRMSYYVNMAILFNKMNQYRKAEDFARRGIAIAQNLRIGLSTSDAKKTLSESLLYQNKYVEALKEIKESIRLAQDADNLEKEMEGHDIAKKIYIRLGEWNMSMSHVDTFQLIKDSIFQLNRIQQVNELQTKYETTKKDAEILSLNKNAELDQVKKQRLWGGLGLLLITGLASIFGIVQRGKKKEAFLSKEKAIEQERRVHLEQELEFKKKELTAKVLQLAGKNEFLQKLEEEVNQLKSSVDSTVNKTSRKISRMIQNDALNEDEWTQFSQEFSSVHKGFKEALKNRYGSFSKSEMRLITLLKMNLSSKDIANILRVSDEGVKKARYRLRKKMGLRTGEDLQSTITSF